MSGAGRLAAENVRATPQFPARAGRGGGGGSPVWARAAARVGPAQRPPRLPQRPRAPRAHVRRPRAMLRQGSAAAEPRAQDGAAPRLRLGGPPVRPGWGRRGGTVPWSRQGGRRAHGRPLPRLGQSSWASCRGRLPACSPRGRRPPPRSPLASLPGHRPSRACSPPRTRPASAPAAGPPRLPPPPSAGFQIEIP